MSLRSYLVVSAPSAGVLNIHEAKNVPLLVQNEERVCKMRSSCSVFAYCKTGRWEGLGTRLVLSHFHFHDSVKNYVSKEVV